MIHRLGDRIQDLGGNGLGIGREAAVPQLAVGIIAPGPQISVGIQSQSVEPSGGNGLNDHRAVTEHYLAGRGIIARGGPAQSAACGAAPTPDLALSVQRQGKSVTGRHHGSHGSVRRHLIGDHMDISDAKSLYDLAQRVLPADDDRGVARGAGYRRHQAGDGIHRHHIVGGGLHTFRQPDSAGAAIHRALIAQRYKLTAEVAVGLFPVALIVVQGPAESITQLLARAQTHLGRIPSQGKAGRLCNGLGHRGQIHCFRISDHKVVLCQTDGGQMGPCPDKHGLGTLLRPVSGPGVAVAIFVAQLAVVILTVAIDQALFGDQHHMPVTGRGGDDARQYIGRVGVLGQQSHFAHADAHPVDALGQVYILIGLDLTGHIQQYHGMILGLHTVNGPHKGIAVHQLGGHDVILILIAAPDPDVVVSVQSDGEFVSGLHGHNAAQRLQSLVVHDHLPQDLAVGLHCGVMAVAQLATGIVAHDPNGTVLLHHGGVPLTQRHILHQIHREPLTGEKLALGHLVPAYPLVGGKAPGIHAAVPHDRHGVIGLSRDLGHAVDIETQPLVLLLVQAQRHGNTAFKVELLEGSHGYSLDRIAQLYIIGAVGSQLAVLIVAPAVHHTGVDDHALLVLDLAVLQRQHEPVAGGDLGHAGEEAGWIGIVPYLSGYEHHRLILVIGAAQPVGLIVLAPGPDGTIGAEGYGEVLLGDNGRHSNGLRLYSIGGIDPAHSSGIIVQAKAHGKAGPLLHFGTGLIHQFHHDIGGHAGLHCIPVDGGKATADIVVKGDHPAVKSAEAQTPLLLLGQAEPGGVDKQVERVHLLNDDLVDVDLEGLLHRIQPQQNAVRRLIGPALIGVLADGAARLLIARDHRVEPQDGGVLLIEPDLHRLFGDKVHVILMDAQLALQVLTPTPHSTVSGQDHDGGVGHREVKAVALVYLLKVVALSIRTLGVDHVVLVPAPLVHAAYLVSGGAVGDGGQNAGGGAVGIHLDHLLAIGPEPVAGKDRDLDRQVAVSYAHIGTKALVRIAAQSIDPVPLACGVGMGGQEDGPVAHAACGQFQYLVHITSGIAGILSGALQHGHGYPLTVRGIGILELSGVYHIIRSVGIAGKYDLMLLVGILPGLAVAQIPVPAILRLVGAPGSHTAIRGQGHGEAVSGGNIRHTAEVDDPPVASAVHRAGSLQLDGLAVVVLPGPATDLGIGIVTPSPHVTVVIHSQHVVLTCGNGDDMVQIELLLVLYPLDPGTAHFTDIAQIGVGIAGGIAVIVLTAVLGGLGNTGGDLGHPEGADLTDSAHIRRSIIPAACSAGGVGTLIFRCSRGSVLHHQVEAAGSRAGLIPHAGIILCIAFHALILIAACGDRDHPVGADGTEGSLVGLHINIRKAYRAHKGILGRVLGLVARSHHSGIAGVVAGPVVLVGGGHIGLHTAAQLASGVVAPGVHPTVGAQGRSKAVTGHHVHNVLQVTHTVDATDLDGIVLISGIAHFAVAQLAYGIVAPGPDGAVRFQRYGKTHSLTVLADIGTVGYLGSSHPVLDPFDHRDHLQPEGTGGVGGNMADLDGQLAKNVSGGLHGHYAVIHAHRGNRLIGTEDLPAGVVHQGAVFPALLSVSAAQVEPGDQEALNIVGVLGVDPQLGIGPEPVDAGAEVVGLIQFCGILVIVGILRRHVEQSQGVPVLAAHPHRGKGGGGPVIAEGAAPAGPAGLGIHPVQYQAKGPDGAVGTQEGSAFIVQIHRHRLGEGSVAVGVAENIAPAAVGNEVAGGIIIDTLALLQSHVLALSPGTEDGLVAQQAVFTRHAVEAPAVDATVGVYRSGGIATGGDPGCVEVKAQLVGGGKVGLGAALIHLALQVAAPGEDGASGVQCHHMALAHSNVYDVLEIVTAVMLVARADLGGIDPLNGGAVAQHAAVDNVVLAGHILVGDGILLHDGVLAPGVDRAVSQKGHHKALSAHQLGHPGGAVSGGHSGGVAELGGVVAQSARAAWSQYLGGSQDKGGPVRVCMYIPTSADRIPTIQPVQAIACPHELRVLDLPAHGISPGTPEIKVSMIPVSSDSRIGVDKVGPVHVGGIDIGNGRLVVGPIRINGKGIKIPTVVAPVGDRAILADRRSIIPAGGNADGVSKVGNLYGIVGPRIPDGKVICPVRTPTVPVYPVGAPVTDPPVVEGAVAQLAMFIVAPGVNLTAGIQGVAGVVPGGDGHDILEEGGGSVGAPAILDILHDGIHSPGLNAAYHLLRCGEAV